MSASSYVAKLLASFVVAVIAVSAGFCQSSERHIGSPAHALYLRSAYAHGYMHGYEEGFHNGDLDIHMGRGERPLSQVKDYHGCAGYRSDFGDRQYFRLGYQQGFREGYTDAANDRSFRAVAETRRIAVGMPVSSPFSERDFDSAFSRGYDNGRDFGTTASMDQVDESYANGVCAKRIPRSESKNQDAFCDAFSRGFMLGFSDGHVNRQVRSTETAKNNEAGKK